jgi:tRNA pseudouridine55 synthase
MRSRRARRAHGEDPAGILVIDKPAGITSFGVVDEVRRRLGVARAGHTGTLDPMATGVLPICLGEATRIAGLLLEGDKAYEGSATLGIETDTLDATGQVVSRSDPAAVDAVTRERLEEAIASMRGPQLQTPPAYSAIRSGGRRSYDLARSGEEVRLEPREVVVYRFELLAFEPPRLDFAVDCSKGTYVRSLVLDLGRELSCGATLSALRRTRSGAFTLERCARLEEVGALRDVGRLPLFTLDEGLAHLAATEVDAAAADLLRHGQPVLPASGALVPEVAPGTLHRARCGGALVALVEQREGKLWPRRVFHGPREGDVDIESGLKNN